jgi:hypothetical protein
MTIGREMMMVMMKRWGQPNGRKRILLLLTGGGEGTDLWIKMRLELALAETGRRCRK